MNPLTANLTNQELTCGSHRRFPGTGLELAIEGIYQLNNSSFLYKKKNYEGVFIYFFLVFTGSSFASLAAFVRCTSLVSH